MKSRNFLIFGFISVFILISFIVDLYIGSISISFSEIVSVFTGSNSDPIFDEIILNYRLPKAITAILAGASLSVAGLIMQTLFRNPLADPYILGVSSGAGLGVAVFTMGASILPITLLNEGWGLIISAIIGAFIVLLLVIAVSFKVQNSITLLIVGIMFGTISGAIINILQNQSNPDALKLFVVWTFGSLSAVNWTYMQVLTPVLMTGFLIVIGIQKRLDGLLLGENYSKSLGITIQRTRIFIVLATGLLAGSITAFTGPIAFIGIAIPHIARGIFKSPTHKVLIPATMLCGALLMLICDIISQIPQYALPINTVSSLVGAPVILWIILRKK